MTRKLELHTTPTITIEQLLNIEGGVRLVVPLDEQTIDSELVGEVKWRDLMNNNDLPSFSVGLLGFKILSIKASVLSNNQICLESDNGKSVLIDDNPKEFITRFSGEADINGYLQACITLTKSVMRSETIAFIEKEFGRSWEDVYGECILLEAQENPDNSSIQTLKDNWERWNNHDIEFSNYYPLLHQQKEKLKKMYGWSTNKFRSINSAINKVREVRNPSSHQNIDDVVIEKIDSAIKAMKTIIKGYEKSMGSEEVKRRCQQLDDKRLLINSIKAKMNL